MKQRSKSRSANPQGENLIDQIQQLSGQQFSLLRSKAGIDGRTTQQSVVNNATALNKLQQYIAKNPDFLQSLQPKKQNMSNIKRVVIKDDSKEEQKQQPLKSTIKDDSKEETKQIQVRKVEESKQSLKPAIQKEKKQVYMMQKQALKLPRNTKKILIESKRLQFKIPRLKQLHTLYINGKITFKEMAKQSAKMVVNAARENRSIIPTIQLVLADYDKHKLASSFQLAKDSNINEKSWLSMSSSQFINKTADNISDQIPNTGDSIRILGDYNSQPDIIYNRSFGQGLFARNAVSKINKIDGKYSVPTSRLADGSAVENKQVALHIGLGDPKSKISRTARVFENWSQSSIKAINDIKKQYSNDIDVSQQLQELQNLINGSIHEESKDQIAESSKTILDILQDQSLSKEEQKVQVVEQIQRVFDANKSSSTVQLSQNEEKRREQLRALINGVENNKSLSNKERKQQISQLQKSFDVNNSTVQLSENPEKRREQLRALIKSLQSISQNQDLSRQDAEFQIGEQLQYALNNSYNQQNHQGIAFQNPSGSEQNVNNDDNAIYADKHVPGGIYVEEDLVYQQLVKDMEKSANLTTEQTQLVDRIAFSMQDLAENVQYVQDESSLGLHLPESIPNALDDLSQKYSDITVVDSRGSSHTIKELLGNLTKVVSFVSKIQGDIDPLADLKIYKPQLDVFDTAIQKNETTRFKIRSGQAFMTRACC